MLSAYAEPQLVDFGIARLAGGSRSRTGQITATLTHAAPEVLDGQPASERSDVYSLASTLYELLSAHAPYVRESDETFHALLARVHAEEPPDLRASGLPEEIWQPLSAALAKDPLARPASALAFAAELRSAQRALGAEVTPLVPPVAGAAASLHGGGEGF